MRTGEEIFIHIKSVVKDDDPGQILEAAINLLSSIVYEYIADTAEMDTAIENISRTIREHIAFNLEYDAQEGQKH